METWVKQYLDLPYKCNVNNSMQCGENIKNITAQPTYKMITLNISNLYTNITIIKTLELIKTKLQPWDKELQREIYDLLAVTVNQNYFEFNTWWQQDDDTPMGSPISSILAEGFLQEIEKKIYPDIIKQQHIKYIARYIDDVTPLLNTF